MTRVAPWLTLAAVLASFCFGAALANGQHLDGPIGPAAFMYQPPAMPGPMMHAPAMHAPPMHAPPMVMPVAYQSGAPGGAMPMMPAMGPMAVPGFDPGAVVPASFNAAHPLHHAHHQKEAPAQKGHGPYCQGKECGMDKICGKVCDCGCDITWRARGSWLSLSRDLGQSPMIFNNATGEINVGADNFDSNYESGFEVSVLHRLYDYPNVIMELSYFQVDNIHDGLNYVSQPGDVFGYLSANAGFPSQVHYESSIRNAEANFVRGGPLGLVDWIVGFRFIQLNEEAFDLSTAGTPTIDVASLTENDLYGAQFGGDLLLVASNRLRVNVLAKGGVFFAKTRSAWFDILNHMDGTFDREDEAAYLAEARLSAAYRVFKNVEVECGYRGIWLDNVALAGEQWTTTNAAGTTIVTGDVLFHGFDLGVVGRW